MNSVPLETSGNIAERIQDLNLGNVSVKLLINGKKDSELFGEMTFTHFGISGPIILSLSRQVVDALHIGIGGAGDNNETVISEKAGQGEEFLFRALKIVGALAFPLVESIRRDQAAVGRNQPLEHCAFSQRFAFCVDDRGG